jgi:hypothetical protein
MQRILLPVLFCAFSALSAFGQLGGQATYEFLNLTPSARVSALGGNLITVRDDDVNLAYANPAMLNAQVHQQLAFNHNFHFGGISNGYAAYGHHLKKADLSLHAGIQYVNYGTFDLTNDRGEIEGQFKASEYAFVLGAAKMVDERLALGANVKMISSQLESYTSLGFTTDLAAMYIDTAKSINISLVFRNVGAQVETYRDANFEPLPFDIQIGISKKLRYLPFRFSVIYHHLDRWNVIYDDPSRENNTISFGDIDTERSPTSIWIDNFFRHLIFNGEFLLGKKENFRLRLGYNHYMRKELSVENFRSLAGFSFGAGVKINRFRLDYGRTNYHLAGGINHLSISTNFREFMK